MEVVPLQVAVPELALFSVRPSSVSVPLPMKLMPALAVVVPLPVMMPPVQVNKPSRITPPPPCQVPPDRLTGPLSVEAEAMFRLPLDQFNVSVAPVLKL